MQKWIWSWMQYYHFCPWTHSLGCSCFSDRNPPFPHELAGVTTWKRCDCEERCLYTVSPLCPATCSRGELQCKDRICYHMDQPLENSCLYLAEVPSAELAVIWLSCCSVICKCKSIISWKTLPWKQTQSRPAAWLGTSLFSCSRVGGWSKASAERLAPSPEHTGKAQAAGHHPTLCHLLSG